MTPQLLISNELSIIDIFSNTCQLLQKKQKKQISIWRAKISRQLWVK